jgi:hypothetical protein
LHVTPDYGGQAAHGSRSRRRKRGRTRTGRATAAVVLVLGIAGLGVSLAGLAIQVMPRQFTARQQQQILDWEEARSWRVLPAGKIFPASVRYTATSALDSDLSLSATRIGIARQASCAAATDSVVAAVLVRNGCQAVLRATYVDGTDSYVVTIGVAAFPSTAQAAAAGQVLTGPTLTGAETVAPGVRTAEFKGTPAASFADDRRQISASKIAATYVFFYTIGYTDDRPFVPVSSDPYTYAEMTSLGAGVLQAVETEVAPSLQQPHCPGAPGC